VVLGRINRRAQMSGPARPSTWRARGKAVGDLGARLGLGVEEAAEAILAVVNQRMAGRIASCRSNAGLDPREFAWSPSAGQGPCTGVL
jgi:N-methylhydantoinase A